MSFVATASHVSLELANGRVLFHDLSFSLQPGLSSLVGNNGVGKTTLARLLAGELKPSSGKISSPTPPRLLTQHQTPPKKAVGEFLAESYSWSLLADELLENIAWDLPCSALSGGQWMRTRLVQVLEEPFLILDEPTNNLDQAGQFLIQKYLRARQGSTLLISHDRSCLELVAQTYELSKQGLQRFGGNYSLYCEAKEQQRRAQVEALRTAKKKREAKKRERIEQEKTLARRESRATQQGKKGGMPRIAIGNLKASAQISGGKLKAQAAAHEQKSSEAVHAAFAALDEAPTMYAQLMQRPLAAQKVVVEAESLNFSRGRFRYQEPLSFVWRGNFRIAIRGSNGSGKSTLLAAIAKKESPTSGSLHVADVPHLFIDQSLSTLDSNSSVLDNVRRKSTLSEVELRNGLAAFLFAGDNVAQLVGQLSGGERLRAALAQGFLSGTVPQLLLLDEPTNNLDLQNIGFVESMVSHFVGAVIVVSHDQTFLDNCGVAEELYLYPHFGGGGDGGGSGES